MSLPDPKDLVAAAQQGKVGKQGLCRVCGAELTDKLMLCQRCETPHHQDCWDYNGGCAIYGCQVRTHVPRIVDLLVIVLVLVAVGYMAFGPVVVAHFASEALYKRTTSHSRVHRSQNSSTPQRHQDDSSNVNRPHRCTQ